MIFEMGNTVIHGTEFLVPWMWKACEIALTYCLPQAHPRLLGFTHAEEFGGNSDGVYNKHTDAILINLTAVFKNAVRLMNPVETGHCLSNEFAISFGFVLMHELRHSWQHRHRGNAETWPTSEEAEADADAYAKVNWPFLYLRNNEPGSISEIPIISGLYQKWLEGVDEKVLFEKNTLKKGLKVDFKDTQLPTMGAWLEISQVHIPEEERQAIVVHYPVEPTEEKKELARMQAQAETVINMYDDFDEGEPYYPPTPPAAPVPTNSEFSMAQLTSEMRMLFLRLDRNIQSLNNGDGTFSNIGAIMHPVDIRDLPAACSIIKKFVTLDDGGQWKNQVKDFSGWLTGKVFSKGTLPGYELWLTVQGVRMWRRILPQNLDTGSTPAAEARAGRKITWVIDSGVKGPHGSTNGAPYLHKIVDGIGYAISGSGSKPWEWE